MEDATHANWRILIVEDEILVALEMEHALIGAGYRVCGIATDTAEALMLARHCNFALIDVNLRDGRTGPALASSLFRDFAVRSLFVTANPGQIARVPDGSAGFLPKPFDGRMLCGAVARALATGHALAANDAGEPVIQARMSDG